MARLRRGRAKRLVLDIGSSAIRLCELSQTKAGHQLVRYYQRDVLVDPLLDEESKKRVRADALKNLLKEAKIRKKKAVFAVPGRSVFTRTRTLPPVPEYKVTQIVRYEIQQQIPFALDQIALDYQILNRTEAGGYDVMMAAIKVEVVEKHLDVLREARCSADTVDVCPLAAYNWLKHTGEFGAQGECVALLDLGAATTDIIIERGGQFRFTRPLNLAGDDITAAIRDAFSLTFPDAEKLKRERAFAPTGDPQRDGKLGEVVGQVLARLVTEINRSFAYFRSLPGGGTIDRVVVTGGGACLRNIVPYFQRQFGVEVRIARPTAGLAIAPAAQEVNEHPEQTSVALGMALRCLETVPIEINLVPPEVLEASRRREQVFYWVLSFIALGLIAASVIPAAENKDKLVRERIDMLQRYLRQYDPALAEDPSRRSQFEDQLANAKQRVTKCQQQLQTLANAYGSAQFWLTDLRNLNNLRPEGGKLWFSAVETTVLAPGGNPGRQSRGGGGGGMSSSGFPPLAPSLKGKDSKNPGSGPQAGPPPTPNGFKIYGYAKDPDTVTEFVNRLKEHKRYKAGVHFSEASVEKVFVSELDNARVPQHGSGGQAPGGPGKSQLAAPLTGPTWDTVAFFHLDAQFGQVSGGGGAAKPANAFEAAAKKAAAASGKADKKNSP